MRTATRMMLAATLVVASIALAGCGGAKLPGNAQKAGQYSDQAQRTVCLSNQQVFESQVAQWAAANPGTPMPATTAELVSAGAVDKVPTCPNGGAYAWNASAGTLTCSVDGHWK